MPARLLIVTLCLTLSACASETKPENPSITLEVIGPKTQVKLSLKELKALKQTGGWTGIRHHDGRLEGPQFYRGPSLNDVLKLASMSLGQDQVLLVEARDGYKQSLSAKEAAGQVRRWTINDQQEQKGGEALLAIVAHSTADKGLGPQGPRLVFVSASKNLAADGTKMVRELSRLSIKAGN